MREKTSLMLNSAGRIDFLIQYRGYILWVGGFRTLIAVKMSSDDDP